jgi:hypothetical protein
MRPSRLRQLTRAAAGSRLAYWQIVAESACGKGQYMRVLTEISQILDALRAERVRVSLILFAEIAKIGC